MATNFQHESHYRAYEELKERNSDHKNQLPPSNPGNAQYSKVDIKC